MEAAFHTLGQPPEDKRTMSGTKFMLPKMQAFCHKWRKLPPEDLITG
jgi:hypothetical protein